MFLNYKYIIIVFLFLAGCSGNQKKDEVIQTVFTFGNSTENSLKSAESIDNHATYQVFFSIENKTECITIDIESVYLQKSFPIQKIPKKTYFIVEKEISLDHKSLKNNIRYIPLGRNFNNEWEIYSPVKICSIKNDPLSQLDNSKYRIRLTTFEKLPVYYVITINSDRKIFFQGENSISNVK
jgi:hypothetical protein